MNGKPAAPELTGALEGVRPGKALDLACGSGRHSVWLAERGWEASAVDLVIDPEFAGALKNVIHAYEANLEAHEFCIEPHSWDLIVCWLYWQPDLLPSIVRGVRTGGIVALAGKTTGRFATSLAQYRAAFPGFTEIASGENELRAFFLARR